MTTWPLLLLHLLLPIHLVTQLGHEKYQAREEAAAWIVKLDNTALPALLKGLENSDPEIKYRCKLLLEKYTYPIYEEAPGIWNLSNDLRYADGKDIADKYYLEAFAARQESFKIKFGLFGWTKDDLGYQYKDVAELATINYIRDMRLRGASLIEVKILWDEMWSNEKTCYHVDFTAYWSSQPPSPLLTKPVKEGDNVPPHD